MLREIDCAICEKPVKIPTKSRFLQMIREGRQPLCGQCRRYACEGCGDSEIRVSARDIEISRETEVTSIVLRRNRGRGAKQTRPLASRRLKRVVTRGCEPQGHNS
jgi:hypothetical protein